MGEQEDGRGRGLGLLCKIRKRKKRKSNLLTKKENPYSSVVLPSIFSIQESGVPTDLVCKCAYKKHFSKPFSGPWY